MALPAVRFKIVVLLLFISCLLLLPLFVGFSIRSLFCFAVRYLFSSFATSRWRRANWLFYFCCVMKVLSLLSFFDSSSRCHVLVWSMWLWQFLVISTYLPFYEREGDKMGLGVRKPVFGGMQTTQAQTSLRLNAVWSAHLLSHFGKYYM